MGNYSDILNGVRAGETNSQMEFYDLFAGVAFQSSYAVLCSSDEAEEIVQDTILKVFAKPDLLLDDEKAMTRVVRRIAMNAAIDVVRKRKTFVISIEDVPTADVATDDDMDDYDYSASEIKRGIAELSDVYRSILMLRLFEKMSFADIAEMLKVNDSTARVQYGRGIEKLRNLLIKRKKDNET